MGVEIAAGFEFAVASLLELAPGIVAFAGRSKTIYSVVGTLISWDECTWDTGVQACDMLYTSFWSIFKVVCNFFGISNFWKSYWKMHCIWTEKVLYHTTQKINSHKMKVCHRWIILEVLAMGQIEQSLDKRRGRTFNSTVAKLATFFRKVWRAGKAVL